MNDTDSGVARLYPRRGARRPQRPDAIADAMSADVSRAAFRRWKKPVPCTISSSSCLRKDGSLLPVMLSATALFDAARPLLFEPLDGIRQHRAQSSRAPDHESSTSSFRAPRRRSRIGQPRQERVHCQHEPRNPHADERSFSASLTVARACRPDADQLDKAPTRSRTRRRQFRW